MENSMEINEFLRKYQSEHTYTPKAGERVVSIAEYSKMTGLSPSTVRFRLQKGRLAGFKSGRNWNIKIDSAEQDSLTYENEKLRLENEALKMQILCIQNIVNVRNVNMNTIEIPDYETNKTKERRSGNG